MTVRLMLNKDDTAGTPCRACFQSMLYTDHDHQVWCGNCDAWNGWWVGSFWAQPTYLPPRSPNGEPGLF